MALIILQSWHDVGLKHLCVSDGFGYGQLVISPSVISTVTSKNSTSLQILIAYLIHSTKLSIHTFIYTLSFGFTPFDELLDQKVPGILILDNTTLMSFTLNLLESAFKFSRTYLRLWRHFAINSEFLLNC